MDVNKPSSSADKPGRVSGRTSSGSVPSASDTIGGVRLTVQSLEEDARIRSRPKEFSNSRSRRNRRKEETGTGKILWLSVMVVAFAYLGLLGYKAIKPRWDAQRKSPAPSVAPAKPESAAVAAAAPPVTPAVTAAVSSAEDMPASTRALDIIAELKQSRLLMEESKKLIRDRKLSLAEDKLTDAARLAPHNFNILMELAQVQLEQKKWLAARDVLLRAVAVNPDSVPAQLMLARAYLQLRQMDDALAMARWVLEAETYSEDAHQIAADVYTANGQHEQAIDHWQRLVMLNSNNHVAENNLGVAQLRIGRINQAVRTFENVIRDEAGNSQAYYYLSLCFIEKGEPELAVDVLVRASGRFGSQFVQSWIHSAEFNSIKAHPSFQRNFGSVESPDVSDSAAAEM